MSVFRKGDEPGGGSQSPGQPAGGPRTFSQEEVDALVASARQEEAAKYAGFDQYRADSAKLREIEDSSKSDLEKVSKQLAEMTKERDNLKAAAERASWVNEVASQTKVPATTVSMLSGTTKEELLEQAKTLAPDFAEPAASEGGKPPKTGGNEKSDFVNQLFG